MKIPQKIALVGNPNSGKSTLFNALTGMNQKIGNYPGVTVERKAGAFKLKGKHRVRLIDLPGTYSLYPNAEDDRITCDVLRDEENPDHPDLVIVVIDATQLRRGLLLCTMAMDMGIPVILCLNMSDLLRKRSIRLNTQLLSNLLGIPVVRISALRKEGLPLLMDAIDALEENKAPQVLRIPEGFRSAIEELKTALNTTNDYRAFQALLKPEEFPRLDQDKASAIRRNVQLYQSEELLSNEMAVRFDGIDVILDKVLQEPSNRGHGISEKLDRFLLHPVMGYVTFIAILLLIFQGIFNWSSHPMYWIESGFGQLGAMLSQELPQGWISDLFSQGIIAGLGGIVIFIPQIAFLFLFISLLEESGYMSRVVFLMDRLMRPFGFSGRSVIPLVGGMACAIPSIMMTRTIGNFKERLITIMVTPLMSCSARIPVYILLISMFVPKKSLMGFLNQQALVMMGIYVLGFLSALISAYVFKRIMKYESPKSHVEELPQYRLPRLRNIVITIYQKCRSFVIEAGKVILVISVLLWFLASYGPPGKFKAIDAKYDEMIAGGTFDPGGLETLEKSRSSDKLQASFAGMFGQVIEPVIRPLGFDWKIGIGLITSFAAREVFVGTMATIYSVGDSGGEIKSLLMKMQAEKNPETGGPRYTFAVALSLLIFYAFAMQCMSTLAVTWKETRSWKWPAIMLTYMTTLAYLASLITYQLLK